MPLPDGTGDSEVFEFGRFRLLPHRRLLLADGQPLELGGRAFDLLVILVRARGALVSKRDLMDNGWPGRIVEENALQAQVSAIRRSFGAERELIRTIAGRGYQFTGDFASVPSAAAPALAKTNVPERVSALIGRDAQIGEVVSLVASHRLVTLIGAGGVGKTRMALEAARQLLPSFADGVWLVNLAPLTDPTLVPAAVASAVGLTLAGGAGTIERVCAAIGYKKLLLVLDNCEHLIEAATRVSEGLLKAGSGVRVLATSREPLHADGEYLYRVPALAVPPTDAVGIADMALWGALQLFLERARESAPNFAPDERLVRAIASICRRLDGIPLALELAAKRTAALGVDVIAARLDDRFGLLTGGRRTALPHQQTLRATLDWSYELLPPPERTILLRFAVFAGAFSLRAAIAVASDDGFSENDVIDGIASLVGKSLLTPAAVGGAIGYRMLETTRAYALEKLQASGAFDLCARRHAAHYKDVFQEALALWESCPSEEWLALYSPCLDNVRVALDWCFSERGDASTGVALTAASVLLWFQLSLIDEFRHRVERALSALGQIGMAESRLAMQLHAAHGWSLFSTGQAREAWTAALVLARRLDDTDYNLRALWGLWTTENNSCQFQSALRLAREFRSVAERSAQPADVLVGERLIGHTLHSLGDQGAAREHVERVVRSYEPSLRRVHIVRFQFDQLTTARVILSRILWLQGFPDQAMQTAQASIDESLSLRHTLSLAAMLAAALPVALWSGNLEAAARFIAQLFESMTKSAVTLWTPYGTSFNGMLLIKRGDTARGLQLLRAGVDEMRGAYFDQYQTAFLFALADALGQAGDVVSGLAAIDEGLSRSELADERWCLPELMRVKGVLESRRDEAGAAIAESWLFRSLDLARQQGTLSWELRAATSLARLWVAQGRRSAARELLAGVRARFAEGFGTADLKMADEVLLLLR